MHKGIIKRTCGRWKNHSKLCESRSAHACEMEGCLRRESEDVASPRLSDAAASHSCSTPGSPIPAPLEHPEGIIDGVTRVARVGPARTVSWDVRRLQRQLFEAGARTDRAPLMLVFEQPDGSQFSHAFTRPVCSSLMITSSEQYPHAVRVRAWQPDEEAKSCPLCKAKFSFTVRKHHCRRCGRVICNDCSQRRMRAPDGQVNAPLTRVCDECVEAIQEEVSVMSCLSIQEGEEPTEAHTSCGAYRVACEVAQAVRSPQHTEQPLESIGSIGAPAVPLPGVPLDQERIRGLYATIESLESRLHDKQQEIDLLNVTHREAEEAIQTQVRDRYP